MTDDGAFTGHDAPPPEAAATADQGPQLDDVAQAERITAFWDTARPSAGRTSHGGAVGERSENVVPPPAWAFGDSPRLADELLRLVLVGTKTATASLVVEYEDAGEPEPRKGDLSILLDGAGEPRALIRTTQVDRVPFGEVTAEHAWREGEDDRTLESWRTEHERYWRRTLAGTAHEFDPSLEVLCERFKVLYSE
ncbi:MULTISPECIES: ASCH domain-containing protein [unclassified Isoptericola]|uniref:ASCH domain-containing protein n=1 Tax=unclassified Isoptericola TaxID=2623355 RepID=UPI002713A9FD|nr:MULTISPECIES: ASCH domain-containing protein [unclassified Isoptericola]MDO8145516.1 ASCH domain-containing protein [Isoptericola sp. 178]MDO8149770.1 ASCH domain-containing protein [Isoptericola sp. b515]